MVEEQFIDAESEPWVGKELDYEKIILKQINHCTDILSKERIGGFTNEKGRYIGDVCEEIIRSVSVLNHLMGPIIKGETRGDKKAIKEIKEKLKEEIDKLGEIEITIGNYRGKMKDIKVPIPPSNPLMKRKINLEADKYEEIFGVLVNGYYKNKMEIRALGRE